MVFGKYPRTRVSAGNGPATSKSCNSATAFTESDLIVHDAHHPRPAYAFQLSHMDTAGLPNAHRGFRAWGDVPRYEDVMTSRSKSHSAKRGARRPCKLLRAGDTWEVK